MASSRRTRRRHQQVSLRRHQLRLEGLEKRYALNAAPVLDISASPQLNSVIEDAGIPVGQVGTLVSDLIDTGGTHNNFSDVNGHLPGIAITGTNLQGGALYYSIDNGAAWYEASAVSEELPLMLYGDSDTRLAFTPSANFNGSIYDVLKVKAWNRTGGYGNGEVGSTVKSNFDTPGFLHSTVISTSGNIAYLADGSEGVRIVDISNSSNPATLGVYKHNTSQAIDVILSPDENTIFTSNGIDGVQVIDVTDRANPSLVGQYNDYWEARSVTLSADGNTAYVAGMLDGLFILDVSDQTNPSLIGSLDTDGQALKSMVSGDDAVLYLCDGTGGFEIIDVSTPASPVRLGGISYIWEAGVPQVTDLAINFEEKIAYLVHQVGVGSVNISDPTDPQSMNGNMHHLATGVTLSADNNLLFLELDGLGIQAYEWFDRWFINYHSTIPYTGTIQNFVFSPDENTVYISDGLNGLQVVNLEEVSGRWDVVSVDVMPVADHPALDSSASLQLRPVTNNAGIPPVGQMGTSVIHSLISQDFPGGVNNFSDSDGDYAGVAIIETNLQGGRLYYSIDNRLTWNDVGDVSEESALVFYADDLAHLAYVPAESSSSYIDDLLTIRAWDRTGGYANGEKNVQVVLPTGVAPGFSQEFDTVSVEVRSNLTPTLDPISQAVVLSEDSSIQEIDFGGVTAGFGEVQALRVTVESNNNALIPQPTVIYTSPDPSGSIAFTPVAGQHGTATITVTVEDPGIDGLFSSPPTDPNAGNEVDNKAISRTFDVIVTSVNDAPLSINLSSSLLEIRPVIIGTTVGNLSTFDQDSGDTHTYSLIAGAGSAGNDAFEIVGNTLRTKELLDHHGQSTYPIRIRSTDTAGLYVEEEFVVTVNERPTGNVVIRGHTPGLAYGLIADANAIRDPDGIGAFSYQWFRNGAPIIGATGITHSLSHDDMYSQITVGVTYDDDAGFSESLISSPVNWPWEAPQNLAAVVNDQGLMTLTWEPPLISAYVIGSYQLQCGNGSVWQTHSYNYPPVVISSGPHTKLWRVRAASHYSNVVAFDSPSSPRNVQATAGDSEVTLSWDEPLEYGGAPLADYEIQWSTDGGQSWPNSTAHAGFETTISSLTSGQEYTFRVVAKNIVGLIQNSASVVSTPINIVPTLDTIDDIYINGNGSTRIITLSGITSGGVNSQQISVSASSSDIELLNPQVVTYLSPAPTGTLSLVPALDDHGVAVITVKVEDVGSDGNLDTIQDNGILQKNFQVTVLEVISNQVSAILAKDSSDSLYVNTQPVTYNQQQVPQAIFGSSVIGADTSDSENALLLQPLGTDPEEPPTHRLLTDETWRINGIFNSLQNASSPVLNLSGREVSGTLNIAAVAGAYEINSTNNPTLVMRRGQTYTFNLNTAGHPFWLQTTGNGYQLANTYDDEFTGNGKTTGEHQWVVPEDAPDEIFYQCEFHPVMFGKIIVVD